MIGKDAEGDLERFLQIKLLDQISVRSYYQFFAAQEALSQQNQSWFKFMYSTIAAVLGSTTSIVTVVGYFQKIGALAIGGIVALLVLAVGVYPIYTRLRPPKSADVIPDTLRLSIHLDQVQKQSIELLLLDRMQDPLKADEIVQRMKTEDLTILQGSLQTVRKIVRDLGKNLPKAMKDIHITQEFLEERLQLGDSILKRFSVQESGGIASAHRKEPDYSHDFPPPSASPP